MLGKKAASCGRWLITAAAWPAPGPCHNAVSPSAPFHPGDGSGESKPTRPIAIARVLTESGLGTEHTDQIVTMVWRKGNSQCLHESGLCAVTGADHGPGHDDPIVFQTVDALIKECVKVARANEINWAGTSIPMPSSYMSNAGNHKPSMLMDIENGNAGRKSTSSTANSSNTGNRPALKRPYNNTLESPGKGAGIHCRAQYDSHRHYRGPERNDLDMRPKSICSRPAFAGIDVGASRNQRPPIMPDSEEFGICRPFWRIQKVRNRFRRIRRRKSGTDCRSHGSAWPSLEMAGVGDIGYRAMPYPPDTAAKTSAISPTGTRTEIGCHARGCFHFYFPQALTIIDIGGQDNKIIKLDESGRRTGFKMNRKCAAGTGAFLEEMSARLDIPLEEMERWPENQKHGRTRQLLHRIFRHGSPCSTSATAAKK